MTYSTSSPPRRISQGSIDNSQQGANLWEYTSADAAATVAGANYFSNGQDLGMALNDIVFVTDTATPLVTSHRVKTLDTATRGVTLGSGTTIGAT